MSSLREGLMLARDGIISLVGAGGKTSLMFKLADELTMTGESVLTTTTTKIFEPSPNQSPCVILSNSVHRILDQAEVLLRKHRHLTAAANKLPKSGKLIGFEPEAIEALWNSGLFRWIIVEADGAAGRPIKVPAVHEPVVPSGTKQVVGVVGLNGVGHPLSDRLVFRPERFAELTGLDFGADITEAAIADVLAHEQGIFKGTNADVICIAFLNQADAEKNLAVGRHISRILSQKKNIGLKRVVIGQAMFEPPILEIYDLNNQRN
jgi:probable selenium-dependent hydroxylase accessory protein YqeC